MKTRIVLGLALLPTLMPAAPARLSDRDIEDAAKSSYNFRKVLDQNVHITVRDGVATLTGTVPTDEQRRLAEDTVLGFQGVTRVDNRLRVDSSAAEGSDEWIALRIRSRLAMRRNVNLADTDVQVKNGVVTLTGTAETPAQKELTEAYAKDIQGVRSVENRMEVAAGDAAAAGGSRSDNQRPAAGVGRGVAGDAIDDSSITAHIKFELFANRATSGLKTKIETHNGHAIITGEAENEAAKSLVTSLAKNVRGVVSVDNRMTVKR